MIRVSERTNSMRKPEKFVYREHLTSTYMNMLRLCIKANEIHTELDVLRSLIDTAASPEDRLISNGLHEVWSKELNEIGRMLGGWIKSND